MTEHERHDSTRTVRIDVDCRTVAFCTITVDIDEADLNVHDAVRDAVLATMPDLSYEDVAAVAVLDWDVATS